MVCQNHHLQVILCLGTNSHMHARNRISWPDIKKETSIFFGWAKCPLSTHPVRSCQHKIRIIFPYTFIYPVSTASFDINRKLSKNTQTCGYITLWYFYLHTHSHTMLFIFRGKNRLPSETFVLKIFNLIIWFPAWRPNIRPWRSKKPQRRYLLWI